VGYAFNQNTACSFLTAYVNGKQKFQWRRKSEFDVSPAMGLWFGPSVFPSLTCYDSPNSFLPTWAFFSSASHVTPLLNPDCWVQTPTGKGSNLSVLSPPGLPSDPALKLMPPFYTTCCQKKGLIAHSLGDPGA
jgi:hypothetical protein